MIGDVQYYLTKGETIAFNGQHYKAHITVDQYNIGRHNITTMNKTLVDHSANAGIRGVGMLALESSVNALLMLVVYLVIKLISYAMSRPKL
jgi:hypothetical protein